MTPPFAEPSQTGRYQLQRGEIAAIAADISRQERQLLHGGMSADKEIGKYAGARPACFAILRENLAARNKAGFGIGTISRAACSTKASRASILAASSWAIDQSAHSGWSVTRSRSTLVSTEVTFSRASKP